MNIPEEKFIELLKTSIEQNKKSKETATKDFNKRYYQGKVDALNSVLFYFPDQEK